jgi:O-succinylbenzoic acid--CoA ligase
MNDWLRDRARTSPDAEALVAAESGRTWTYADLDAEVEALAGRLAALGLTAGDHLGVLLETRISYVRLVHAAARLGCVCVPLNARQTPTEIATQVDHADLAVLVCGGDTEPRAVEATEAVPVATVDDPQWEGVAALTEQSPVDFDRADWAPDDTQFLLFTSGTTGEPKAVELTVENLRTSAVTSAFRLGVMPGDRWLVTLPMYHMGGLAPVLRSTLYGTAAVVREGFDPGPAADDIGEYDVTGVSLVPQMLTKMLDTRGTLSDSLRFVLLGGAPAPEDLVRRCRDYSVPVFPTYGMTETASQIATAEPHEAFDYPGTVGRPLLWTTVTVVGEDGDPVPTGETGELVVDGPTVSPGYYRDPERTAGSRGPHGLYTGDVGKVDESGRLWVLDRVDDVVITGGENVQPGEVAAVLRDHPGVEAVTVVGVPDDEWGERVGALVVLSDESTTRDDLETHCRERLADFKVPKQFLVVDDLPRTPSGTVRRELAREALVEDAAVPVADAEGGTGGEVPADDPAADPAAPSPDVDRSEDPDGAAAPDDAGRGDDPDDTDGANDADESVDGEADPTDGSDTTDGSDSPDETGAAADDLAAAGFESATDRTPDDGTDDTSETDSTDGTDETDRSDGTDDDTDGTDDASP